MSGSAVIEPVHLVADIVSNIADASLREIGVALFGTGRVARDWDDSHRHLKDRVRRAVARGRRLMEGRYMEYLK